MPVHDLEWYGGPFFDYKAGRSNIRVNVTASSWPIRGLATAQAICDALREIKKLPIRHVLDFGAGSWLRYVSCLKKYLRAPIIDAVEYDQAFRDAAAGVKQENAGEINLMTPSGFAKMREPKYDLIVMINVLNTIPEESHQREIFAFAARLLNPLGRLMVYQRKWAERENPSGSIAYGDGWIVPQPKYGCHAYHGKTGANWFNARAAENKLKPVDLRTTLTSDNTLLRVWKNPF